MESQLMKRTLAGMALMASAAVVTGCHSKALDKEEFRSALNRYYGDQQHCLFNPEIKLPVQAEKDDEGETRRFDTLTDAGLLQRTPQEKKRFLIGSKQVTDYDLTTQGRSHWTANASQPGFGNFCLGTPTVQTIDNFVPAGTTENQYSVTYTYAVKLPEWANNAEIQTAFPRAARESAGQTATATIMKQGDGWQVGNVTVLRGAALPE